MASVASAEDDRPGLWIRTLVWAHALLFGMLALACYVSPETAFGESAWLPLSRLAVLLLGAALTALVIVLVGSAWSGNPRQISLALLAALALDAQAPVFLLSQLGAIEYLDSELGIPWYILPLTLLIIVGATVHALLRQRANSRAAGARALPSSSE